MSAGALPAGSVEPAGPLTLESGARLPSVTVAFRTWGRLDADVDRWWGALLGPGRALDPDRDFVVCSNVLGGCYEAQRQAIYADPRWLRHHGRALVDRFDASAYVTLTKAMDTHDVGRGRGGWREALATVRVPALVVSIDTDVLYPPVEQEELAEALPLARLARLASPHGHGGFLIEGEATNALVVRFRRDVEGGKGREEDTWVA